MDVHVRVESFIHMSADVKSAFLYLLSWFMIIKTYEMTDLRNWKKVERINTPFSEKMYACSS